MGPLEVGVLAIWAMLPAYLPNNVAVVAGGGPPIDGGRRWRGARLLGDGKTWRGLAAGVLAGLLVAVVLTALVPAASGVLGVPVPAFTLGAAVALPAGALLGDIGASFLKRRLGRERGAAVPLLDQLDLVVGAVALAFLLAPGWAAGTFTLPVLAAVVVLTPALHLGTNAVGYALGLKREPW
ncbi:MAG: CDP-2,3-bis-(O-geranylgeranyl)-sn-glycerol synthase [Halobacteriales archaeon]|nr:CDP-2,3-bis-(O-geranylgeranyl)-sn-glycerol synthase [Halobacteriales archaeon]